MNTTAIREENVILREIIEKNQELFDLLSECKMIEIEFLKELLGLSNKTIKTRINKIRNHEVGKKLVRFTGSGKNEKIYVTDRFFSLINSNKKSVPNEDITFEKINNARCRAFSYTYGKKELKDEIKSSIKELSETTNLKLQKDNEILALKVLNDFSFQEVEVIEDKIYYTVTLARDFEKYKTLIKKIEQLILITEILKMANFKNSSDKDIKIKLTILSNRPYQLKAFVRAKNNHKRIYNTHSAVHNKETIFNKGKVKIYNFEKYYKNIIRRVDFKIIDIDEYKITAYNTDKPKEKKNC